jgi:hypothetical protein
MDTKQLTALLTGAVVASSALTYTATEFTGEELRDGEKTPIVEEVPAVQATIYVDNVCGENKLHTSIGEVHLCADETVYTSVLNSVIEDVKTTDHRFVNEKGELCEQGSEGCIEEISHIKLENKDSFPVIVVKEDMKDGKSDILNIDQIDPEVAKEQILEILGEVRPSLEVVEEPIK